MCFLLMHSSESVFIAQHAVERLSVPATKQLTDRTRRKGARNSFRKGGACEGHTASRFLSRAAAWHCSRTSRVFQVFGRRILEATKGSVPRLRSPWPA
jgi:hypothetical protein